MAKASFEVNRQHVRTRKGTLKTTVSFLPVASQNRYLVDGEPNGRSVRATYNVQTLLEEKPVDSHMKDERDFKSYAVKKYDAHQEAAKKKHGENLKEIVNGLG